MSPWDRSQGVLCAASLLALIALASCGRPRVAPAENIVLVPGAAFPRSLSGKGSYRFRFEVAADRFLRLDVEQRGVDVLVALEDSAGHLLYEIDTPTGNHSSEPVLAVTAVSDRYVLVVQPLAPGAKGDFVLKVREVRPAGTKDRLCAAAARVFARAETGWLGADFEREATAYGEALLHL
ncbi:MAG TPA: hypothetical protein VGQ28_03865, partial [Thermoanaerobaculia bacterium]|nr:hypothetical protein [Thermoanaerobaculia bacterium]